MTWTQKQIDLLKQTYATATPEVLSKYLKMPPKEIVEEALQHGLERDIQKVIKYCQVAVTSPRWLKQYRGRSLRAIPSMTGIGYDLVVDKAIVAYNLPLGEITLAEEVVVIPVNQPNLTPEQRSQIMENAVKAESNLPEVALPGNDVSIPTTDGNADVSKFPIDGNAKAVTPDTGNAKTPTPTGNAGVSVKSDAVIPRAEKPIEDPTLLKVPPKGKKVEALVGLFSPAVRAMINKKELINAGGSVPQASAPQVQAVPPSPVVPPVAGEVKGKDSAVAQPVKTEDQNNLPKQAEPTVVPVKQESVAVVRGEKEGKAKKSPKGEWTAVDEDYLRKEFPMGITKDIAKSLGRTEKAVTRRAEKLGLKKVENPVKSEQKSPEIKDAIAVMTQKLERELSGDVKEEFMAVLNSNLDRATVAEFMFKTAIRRWTALITYEAKNNCFLTESMQNYNGIMNGITKIMAIEHGIEEGGTSIHIDKTNIYVADMFRRTEKYLSPAEREMYAKLVKLSSMRERESIGQETRTIPALSQTISEEEAGEISER